MQRLQHLLRVACTVAAEAWLYSAVLQQLDEAVEHPLLLLVVRQLPGIGSGPAMVLHLLQA